MRCIFCLVDRPPSHEHVLPLAIGGTITTDRVCRDCNSNFGSRIDGALSNFLPVRIRRAELKLAGNAGVVPNPLEFLEGEAMMVGEKEHRVRSWLNPRTRKLETEQLFHSEEYEREDGQKDVRFTIDARRREEIPKIVQRARKRAGLSPLTDEQLRKVEQQITVNTIEQPLIMREIKPKFDYLRHSMLKMVYELAFLWLGEEYLDDPSADVFREAIKSKELDSTDAIPGYIDWAAGCTAFGSWSSDRAHHLAYATELPNGWIVVSVRIFDIFAASVPVTVEGNRYLRSRSDRARLRFVAIDAPSGRTIDAPWRRKCVG